MACNVESLAAPACLEFASSRKQLETLLLFLCQVLNNLDGGFSCGDWDAIKVLTDASSLGCKSAGQARIMAANVVCDGLDVTCTDLQCFSIEDLERMKTYLMCRAVNLLNP